MIVFLIAALMAVGCGNAKDEASDKNGASVVVAVAGKNQHVVLGDHLTLNGNESRSSTGRIVLYQWFQENVLLGQGATLTVNTEGLFEIGSHDVVLVVTDSFGVTDSDRVVIIVEAPHHDPHHDPPLARAGNSQRVTMGETFHLDGTGSSSQAGEIVLYEWFKEDVLLGRGATLTVNTEGLFEIGSHDVVLVVTDSFDASDSDFVTIIVLAQERRVLEISDLLSGGVQAGERFLAQGIILGTAYRRCGTFTELIIQDRHTGQTMLLSSSIPDMVLNRDFRIGDLVRFEAQLDIETSGFEVGRAVIIVYSDFVVVSESHPRVDYRRAGVIRIDSHPGALQRITPEELQYGAVYAFEGEFFFNCSMSDFFLRDGRESIHFHYNRNAGQLHHIRYSGKLLSLNVLGNQANLGEHWVARLLGMEPGDCSSIRYPGDSYTGRFYAILHAATSDFYFFSAITPSDFDVFRDIDEPGTTVTTSPIREGTPDETMLYRIDTNIPGPTVFIIAGIHGNERAGWHAALELLAHPFPMGVIYILPLAYKRSAENNPPVRFIPGESDLNRSFGSKNPHDGSNIALLAEEIFQAMIEADPGYLFDLHESRNCYTAGGLGNTVLLRSATYQQFVDDVLERFNALPENEGKEAFVRLGAFSSGLINVEFTKQFNRPAFTIETNRATPTGRIDQEAVPLELRVQQQLNLLLLFLSTIWEGYSGMEQD